MECFFEARPISSDTLRQAYAVMLLGFPALTLPEFRKCVARDKKSGVMTGLFDRRGYVHALFRCRVIAGPPGARKLSIADLILSDAISSRLGNEMADALMIHAVANRCDQLTVDVVPLPQKERAHMGNMLQSLGFYGHDTVYERRV